MTATVTVARVHPASPAQIEFILKLCKQLEIDRKYRHLSMTAANKIIRELVRERDKATPAQVRYVRHLCRKHGVKAGPPGFPGAEVNPERMTRAQVAEFVARFAKSSVPE